MNRFRVTLIAVCCVLAWLAYMDISLLLRNPDPLKISIEELSTRPAPPREWLHITGGFPQLLEGINMTGEMQFTAFLIPLTDTPAGGTQASRIWFECRDPAILEALSTYYFSLDTPAQREAFLDENAHLFEGMRSVTGMTAGNLVARSNQRQLLKLLTDMDVDVPENPIFISEGKEPARWRGFFYAIVACAGFIKLARNQRSQESPDSD